LLDGENGAYYEKLTESQVDDWADNNGYLESEVDGTIGNELPWGNLSSAAANDYTGDLDALVFGTVICDGCTNAPERSRDGWVTTTPIGDGSTSKYQSYREIGFTDNLGNVFVGRLYSRVKDGTDFSDWGQNYTEAFPQPTNDKIRTANPIFGTIAAHSIVEVTMTVNGASMGDPVLLGPNGSVTAGVIYTARVSAANTVTIAAANITSSSIAHPSVSITEKWTIRILK
jgi:hypothetical protein